eukprot:CAMPEP_0197591854 /NCGR_PEP_ID=MMETSP1326-20131121/13954_1 /TAXON_ID=1155430 /ORGANISM="Genus nov. species nov., Strain RCC2288" /LENGTH=90 /DNA_ID=CAMNT_0043157421 /DNA_START=186 /DNA_END=455 /DNA_ORIENTATION=-
MVASTPDSPTETQQAPQQGAGARVRDVLPSDPAIPIAEHRAAFNGAVATYLQEKASNIKLLTPEIHQKIVDLLLEFSAAPRALTPEEHRW